MKNILTYSLMTCIICFSGKAQIGINTKNPLGILHIDAGVVGNTTDDIIIDNQGRIGIGTITPTNLLHIKTPITTPAIAIKDGNQGELKLLTSNSIGVGTWKHLGVNTIKGNLSPTGRTYLISNIPPHPTIPSQLDYPLYPLDGTIVLPPGRWTVYSNFILHTTGSDHTQTFTSNTWIRLSYSDTYGGVPSKDIKGAPWTSGAIYSLPFGVVQGFNIILNSTSSPKTYHLGIVFADQNRISNGVQINNLANANNIENGIIAIKIGND